MNLLPADADCTPYLGARRASSTASGIGFHLWKTLVWHADAVATATGVTTVNIPSVGPYIERIRIT